MRYITPSSQTINFQYFKPMCYSKILYSIRLGDLFSIIMGRQLPADQHLVIATSFSLYKKSDLFKCIKNLVQYMYIYIYYMKILFVLHDSKTLKFFSTKQFLVIFHFLRHYYKRVPKRISVTLVEIVAIRISFFLVDGL